MQTNFIDKYVYLFFLLLLLSCNNDRSKTTESLTNLNGKIIVFPKTLETKSNLNILFNQQLKSNENKIVIYYDTTGCMECKMKLNIWNDIVKEIRDSALDVSLIFIVSPNEGRRTEINRFSQKYRFNYPIFIDSLNKFSLINKLPKEAVFHTFLLDNSNRIVIVGSPIGNMKIWKLYKDYLKKRISKTAIMSVDLNKKNNFETTQIQIKNKSVKLGELPIQFIKIVSFRLKNIGKKPLIFQSVNTSCSCMTVEYDNKPVVCGETTTIILKFKPNGKGFFNKTASVVCNIPEGFIRLSISGEVTDN